MKDLEGKTIPIGKLLSQEFFFRVPDYQRTFSWDGDNFDDLIDDLLLPKFQRKKECSYYYGGDDKIGKNQPDTEEALTTPRASSRRSAYPVPAIGAELGPFSHFVLIGIADEIAQLQVFLDRMTEASSRNCYSSAPMEVHIAFAGKRAEISARIEKNSSKPLPTTN